MVSHLSIGHDHARPQGKRTSSFEDGGSATTKRRLAISVQQPREDLYTLLKVIDRGSFGIVTLVQLKADPSRKYACKRLPLAKVQLEIIKKEVALIRKAHHQHVVRVVDEYKDAEGDSYHIIMEPAADYDLERYLRKMNHHPKTAEEWETFGQQRLNLLRWMGCLTVAVQHIHGLGIRHRDIKPENILIHGDNILLTDFGTSFHSELDTRYTCTSTPGTAKYLPPEAASNRRFGRSGDIFSLGCVLWEMADNHSGPILSVPFPSIGSKSYSSAIVDHNLLGGISIIKESLVLRKRLPESSRLTVSLLPALLSLTRSMLEPAPSRRPTANDVVKAFTMVMRDAHFNFCTSLDHGEAPSSSSSVLDRDTNPDTELLASLSNGLDLLADVAEMRQDAEHGSLNVLSFGEKSTYIVCPPGDERRNMPKSSGTAHNASHNSQLAAEDAGPFTTNDPRAIRVGEAAAKLLSFLDGSKLEAAFVAMYPAFESLKTKLIACYPVQMDNYFFMPTQQNQVTIEDAISNIEVVLDFFREQDPDVPRGEWTSLIALRQTLLAQPSFAFHHGFGEPAPGWMWRDITKEPPY